jgi:hypothetical protein
MLELYTRLHLLGLLYLNRRLSRILLFAADSSGGRFNDAGMMNVSQPQAAVVLPTDPSTGVGYGPSRLGD